jgi:hypothetical protein
MLLCCARLNYCVCSVHVQFREAAEMRVLRSLAGYTPRGYELSEEKDKNLEHQELV